MHCVFVVKSSVSVFSIVFTLHIFVFSPLTGQVALLRAGRADRSVLSRRLRTQLVHSSSLWHSQFAAQHNRDHLLPVHVHAGVLMRIVVFLMPLADIARVSCVSRDGRFAGLRFGCAGGVAGAAAGALHQEHLPDQRLLLLRIHAARVVHCWRHLRDVPRSACLQLSRC